MIIVHSFYCSRQRCGTVCGVGAQIVFLIMTLIDPFMPCVARQIREQLNVTKPLFSLSLLPFLPPGHKIGRVGPLFQKLEADVIAELRKRFAGSQADRQETKEQTAKSKLKSPSKSPASTTSVAPAVNGTASEATGGGSGVASPANVSLFKHFSAYGLEFVKLLFLRKYLRSYRKSLFTLARIH